MRLLSAFIQAHRALRVAVVFYHRCSPGITMTSVRITVKPDRSSLFDRPVNLKVEGLRPRETVTLQSTLTDEKGELFEARARYQADEEGHLDLASSPALGGDYSGVEPMGFIWALKPRSLYGRLVKRDVSKPFRVDVEVRAGWQNHSLGPLLATCALKRHFIAQGVRRVTVREGRVRGTLFLPAGDGPFPGIIDLGGTAGGLLEHRASLLASHGFAAMALAYFGFEDLPAMMSEFHLEYFEEALRYLQGIPQVKKSGIGVMGLSKGADLALSMATFLHGISAVVSVSGCNSNSIAPLHYKGVVVPGLGMSLDQARADEFGVLDFSDCYEDPRENRNQACVVPIERSSAHFLFVVAEDDQNWKSSFYAQEAVKRLNMHGRAPPELLSLPGAGHLLEPPYFPHCRSSFHKIVGAPLLWGGECQAHAVAQEKAWKKISHFFQENLNEDEWQDPKSKL
ncbi:ACOT2 thioesterase, partial [Polypterus senegalus]